MIGPFETTEAAVLALNVAELDATQSSDGLIAIMTQFGLTASDLELVIDKLNITADNAAVTTQKLLTALQRTGSSAANANLSLDETIALITALSVATGRSGENLGTALNSLIQYSSKASALDVFAKLSDNVAETVTQYKRGAASILDVWYAVSDEIQHLSEEQANLLDSYFDTEDGSALKDALSEDLEEIYDDLAGVYTTANTFRKNYFIALLGNMDEVKKSLGTMDGAEGYSMLENEEYLDTYTAKLNALNAQWQEFLNGAQSILTIKKIGVDAASGLLTVADALDKVHLLMPLVTTGAILLGTALRNKAMSEAAARVNAYSSALIKNKTATIADATAISKLTSKQKQQVIQDIAAAAASGKLTGAEAKQLITEAGLSTSLTKLNAKKKAKIQATIQEAVASGTITAAQGAEITTSLGLTAANTGLSFSFSTIVYNAVVQAKTVAEFPPAGKSNLLYIDITASEAYYWNEAEKKYFKIVSDEPPSEGNTFFRRATLKEWEEENPILGDGVMGYVSDDNSAKIGDGKTKWLDLAWFVQPTTAEYLTADDIYDACINGKGISAPLYTSDGELLTDESENALEYNFKLDIK